MPFQSNRPAAATVLRFPGAAAGAASTAASLLPVLVVLHQETSTPGRVGNALEQRPFLGICLGAQMLAMQLGARVAPHPEGRTEIGYYPIRPTAAGLALCPDWPGHVYHWHREGFELPRGAELLAEGGDFPVQALRSGHAFGFQFHPDVTYAMMHRWTTRGHGRLELPGACPRHHHFEGRALHDAAERAWLKHFLDDWLTRMPLSVMSEAAE